MWQTYFGEQATIHGIDIQAAVRAYEGDRIHIHVGDQADRAFWEQFKKDVPVIDVLIDDGGHHPDEMRVTFEELFPILRPGGVYVCEDIVNGNEFLAYLAGLAEHLTTFESTELDEPGVASSADGLQQAIQGSTCTRSSLWSKGHPSPWPTFSFRSMDPSGCRGRRTWAQPADGTRDV